jgi:hypothetical protein
MYIAEFKSYLLEVKTGYTVTCLLLIQASLLSWSASKNSPTLNEPAHLVAGISYWRHGRFDLYRVNPPLARIFQALPVLALNPKTDWDSYYDTPGGRPVFSIGRKFVEINGKETFRFITFARWASIPLTLLGGYICFLWAQQLYGTNSGFIALLLWTFSPNILAHGQLVTTDAGATSLGLLAAYSFWRWLRSSNWTVTVFAGCALGLAELTKMTWLFLFVLWPLLFICWEIASLKAQNVISAKGARLCQLFLILFLGLYILNLGYGFEGTFTPLGKIHFVSKYLTEGNTKQNRFKDTWLGHIPMPFPRNYLIGLDIQKKDVENENGETLSYLRGKFQNSGWWYYYCYALAVKVPLGTWLLFFLTLISLFMKKCQDLYKDDWLLLIPACCVLILVSMQTGYNHHMRYVLVIFPFIFIWVSQLGRYFSSETWKFGIIVMTSLLWTVTSSLSTYPHSLSYFNELAGGPKNGHAHLIHSNIDWGQDLLYLRSWIKEHPEATPLYLAYYNDFDARYLGFQYARPPMNKNFLVSETAHDEKFNIQPGWYAISVNYLRGDPWRVSQNSWSYFQRLTPNYKVGYSIYIYHITPSKANRIQSELNLPINAD